VLKLHWGALLYCTEYVGEIHAAYNEHMSTDGVGDEFVTWKQIGGAVMTSMVVSLDLLPLYQEIVLMRYTSWTTEQLTTLLCALEASHWHAKSFNESTNLRKSLHRLSFMPFRDKPSRLPHLLEQEVQSLTLILEAVLRMHSDSESVLRSSGSSLHANQFASSWLARYVSAVSLRPCNFFICCCA
jgi:hypothetical protein